MSDITSESFEVLTSQECDEPSATITVSLRVLHQMLRLPPEVYIAGIESDPANSRQAKLTLTGPGLPAGHGPATVNYTFEHTTIVKYAGITRNE